MKSIENMEDAENNEEVRQKDEVRNVLSEWEHSSKFKVKKFFLPLFPAALLYVYSFVAHTFLGTKYLNTGLVLQSENFLSNNPSCQNLTVKNLSHQVDGTTTIFYAKHSYTCHTQNMVFGIATLFIQFLPGIQWYTTLRTENLLGRFLSSLLFPFFSILFKIAHCFHQGPNTAKMNEKMTSCMTLKRMVQLVLQVVIILWSGSIANVSQIQYLVLTTSLFFATKGTAKEAARKKMTRNRSDPEEFFEVPFKETAKMMPWFALLTTFRVLTISLVIVALPIIWIPIYAFLVLIIICIGYWRTKRNRDFSTRGLTSAFTSVDDRYQAERIFQNYWFVVNLLLLTLSSCKALLDFPQSVLLRSLLSSDTVTRNPMVFKIVLIVCITSGLISFTVFHVQQHMFSSKPVELTEKMKWDFWSITNETSIRSIPKWAKARKRKEQTMGQAQKVFLTLKDLLLTLLEYGNIVRESYVWVMLGTSHPIWATTNILIMFLPGIEWQSYSHQKLPGKVQLCPEEGYRLSWFISSLFFPLYAIASRMVAFWRAMLNLDMDEIPRLNVLMNGPRVIWGRMPSLTLSLFILFKDRFDTYKQDALHIPGSITHFLDKLICNHASQDEHGVWSVLMDFYCQMVVLLFIDGLRASWMMSEQMVLWEHERTADEKTPDLSPFESWKKQAKLFPFVFLCCVFRGLSFALIVSMLRYWSVLLYIVLILGVISVSGYINRKDHNFVIRGVKSVLSIVDDRNDFKHESVFQIYWAVCNCLIVGMLTALVKLPKWVLESVNYGGSSLLDLKVDLGLDDLFIVNSSSPFFVAIVCAIFATGFLSLLTHFYLMKHQTRPTPKSKDEEFEMEVVNTDEELYLQ